MERSEVKLGDCELGTFELDRTDATEPDSLFERWAWFYALCREYLFRDHTLEITHSLFPPTGPSPATHLLELGCGPGFYACKFAQTYPQMATTGVDLSQQLIARARSRAASRHLGNCTFRHGDAQDLPDLPGPFDAVIVSRLFLIVPNKQAVLAEILRVLRPGGRCFIAEPTSGFRTRLPLSCMWLLARLTSSPAGKYREPQQAEVMSRPDFAALIHSQPWHTVDLQYDGWYQYAVCTKAPLPPTDPQTFHPSAQGEDLLAPIDVVPPLLSSFREALVPAKTMSSFRAAGGPASAPAVVCPSSAHDEPVILNEGQGPPEVPGLAKTLSSFRNAGRPASAVAAVCSSTRAPEAP